MRKQEEFTNENTNMKRVAFLIPLIVALVMGCSDNPNSYYVITGDNYGSLPKGEWAYLFVQKEGSREFEQTDSVRVNKIGVAIFKGEIDTPRIAQIRSNIVNGTKTEQKFIITTFILEPGVIKSTRIDAAFNTPSGTPLNDKINRLSDRFKELTKQFNQNQIDYSTALATMCGEAAEVIVQYPDSPLQYFIADNFGFFLETAQQLELISLIPNSKEYFTEELERAKDILRVTEGADYLEIKVPNLNGDTISLKSVVETPSNRYVLLEFWASGCHACIEGVPQLKELYQKYKSQGVEFYSVSLDTQKEIWQNTTQHFAIPWINCSSLQSWNTSEAAKQYAVYAIPTYYIIDCNSGKIVAKHINIKSLQESLSQLLTP